ncbi:MAG: hypothetical protein ACW99F_03850 [Candidatus Hodarchaeales archaeon]|jgi:hypothetical protein
MTEEQTIREKKAMNFMEHIEEHLKDERLSFGANAEVICTICGKSVDQIWIDSKND